MLYFMYHQTLNQKGALFVPVGYNVKVYLAGARVTIECARVVPYNHCRGYNVD